MMLTCEEKTYERLKTLILTGKLPKGEFLPQRGLAQQVGATIVTLRSALRLLGNDGLIENVPKWGVRIPVDTIKSVTDRYYVRELLEAGAAEKLLENPTGDMQAELIGLAKECDRMVPDSPESYRDFAEKHVRLHLRMAELSGNQLLVQTLTRLNFRSMMLSNARNAWMIQLEYLQNAHHENFIRELFSLPRAEALNTVHTHIRRGLRMELAVLEREKEYAGEPAESNWIGETAR